MISKELYRNIYLFIYLTMLGTKKTIEGFLWYNTKNKDIFNGISINESIKGFFF